jgi:hypothetical protein
MDQTNRWSPGDVILYRGIWCINIYWAIQVIIVRDDPDRIIVYWRAGTPVKRPSHRISPKEMVEDPKPNLIDGKWTDTDILMFATPGASHSIYAMWESSHSRFKCWYINLQEPLLRTPLGLDTTDYLLDIVVEPERTNWRWKDEDEFDEAIELGIFALEKAKEIRNEGKRVIQEIESNQSPFCDGWENWHPPEDWIVPDFPKEWDTIFA